MLQCTSKLARCKGRGSGGASCSAPPFTGHKLSFLTFRALLCRQSAPPLEPLQNRPPSDERYLEDAAAQQAEPSIAAGAEQPQAATARAVVPAEPPAAHKLASVELISGHPRTDPVFRPVRGSVLWLESPMPPNTVPHRMIQSCTTLEAGTHADVRFADRDTGCGLHRRRKQRTSGRLPPKSCCWGRASAWAASARSTAAAGATLT